jgi:hypothetical protein
MNQHVRHVQTCTHCGTQFFKPASRLVGSGNQFCSRACFSAWKRGRNAANELVHERLPTDEAGRVQLTCAICSKSFTVPHHMAAGTRAVPKYCSLVCAGVARRRPDSQRSRRQDPIIQWRQSEGWPKFVRGWLYTHQACEQCGAAGRRKAGLVVHHKIDPNPTLDRTLLFDHDNLVVLCRACHVRLHRPRLGT